MPSISTEAKVGLFTLLMLGVLFWVTFHLSKVTSYLAGGNKYTAVVSTVHQIGVDSVVEVAGVRVGRVTGIELGDGGQNARFTFRLDDEVVLYEDVLIRVQTVGLLGDRYVNVLPGTPGAGKLPPGSTITNTMVPLSFEEMMDDLTPILENLSVITQEMRGMLQDPAIKEGIPSMISSLNRSAVLLEDLVVSYETFIGEFIENSATSAQLLNERLPELFDRLFEQVGDADIVLDEMAQSVTTSAATVNRVADLFEETAADLKVIIAGIERGEGTIGTLLRDEETAREVKEVVTSINDKLSRIDRLKTTVEYLGTYNLPGDGGRGEGFRHEASLRLQPSYDHYYEVGIVSRTEDVQSSKETTIIRDVEGGPTTRYTETELVERDKLLFNFQLAKRFYDLTVRGGVIESEGGVGLDYALWDDRIWLRTEAFDFARSGDHPRWRGWGELRLFDHLTIAAGTEDIVGQQAGPRFSAGAGIFFTDEDLKLLFGSLPSFSVQ